MGTNYYIQSKACNSCGHCKNEKHIGKSSYGWQFHFRGYRDQQIVSFQDWIKEINEPNTSIINEYGEKISCCEFIEMVNSKKDEMNSYNINVQFPMNEKERRYLNERLTKYPSDNSYSDRSWKDNEGHSFTDQEFS